MDRYLLKIRVFAVTLLALAFFFYGNVALGQATSHTFSIPGSYTYTTPAGIQTNTFKVFGGGGGGGNGIGHGGAGGGSGASNSGAAGVGGTVNVTYFVTVGAGGVAETAGGTSSFILPNTSINFTLGGGGGGSATSVGTGGTSSNGFVSKAGSINNGINGGNGGDAGYSVNPGGTGGAGGIGSASNGSSGAAPGGGGGGGGINGTGGKGGDGQVIVGFASCPVYNITGISGSIVCGNTSGAFTVSGTPANLPPGTYLVTYDTTGPVQMGLTALMVVNTAGSGTFTATGFNTEGPSMVKVTALSSGSSSDEPGTYFCTTSGLSVTSPSFTVSMPVTTQPSNRTLCAGTGTTFSIVASGAGLTYQWQVSTDGGSTFNDILDGTLYSNVTTATVTLTNVTTAMTAYQYRCVVTGNCGASVSSDAGVLTVSSGPSITTQPSNITSCEGGTYTFSVVASGAGLTYQWQRSTDGGSTFNDISQTTATATFYGGVAAGTTWEYRCVVTGCGASVISDAGVLTVNSAPSITTQPPGNFGVCVGHNPVIRVAASGSDLTYQWQLSTDGGATYNNLSNAAPYSEVTTASLNITASTVSMNNYRYRCKVSGSCGSSINTYYTVLKVGTSLTVQTQPSNKTICAGANTTFSVVASGAGLTYQWQVSTDGGSTFDDIFDGTLYSNVTTATVTLNGVTAAMTAYQYRCIVTGTCYGEYSDAGVLTVKSPPSITTQPSNSTICAGDNTIFTVAASGSNLTYQWQLSSDAGGFYYDLSNVGLYSTVTTSTLNISVVTVGTNNYLYRCKVSGSCGSLIITNKGILKVSTPAAITTQPTDKTICEGVNTTFTVLASGTGLTYQWQVRSNGDASYSNVSDGPLYSNVTTATLNITAVTNDMNSNKYRCVVSGTCGSSVKSNAGILTVNSLSSVTTQPSNRTICAGTNTTFSVAASGAGLTYQWQVSTDGGSTFNDIFDGTLYSNVTTATITLTNVAADMTAYQYHCVINGVCGAAVSSDAGVLSVNSATSITTQPSNSTICAGDNTMFTVAASGSNLAYQWQLSTDGGVTFGNLSNAGPYSEVTTATLNISASSANMNNFWYRCKVSGSCGSLISTNILLKVRTSAALTTQPSNSTICAGLNTTFAAAASGAGLAYQWQVSIDGGSTFDDIFDGTLYSNVTTATVTLTNVTAAMNAYQYRCVVTGICGPPVSSNAGVLKVKSPPSITTQPSNSSICAGDTAMFTVAASGSNLTYQWQLSTDAGALYYDLSDGGLYSTVTTATLNISAVTVGMNNYWYRCNVSGSCGSLVSTNIGILKLRTSAAVTTQPSNRTICVGSNTTFAVAASGSGLTYQWQNSTDGGVTFNTISNGTLYSNVTTATLDIAQATVDMSAYQYRCVVSGICGSSANSNAGILTVNSLPSVTTQPSDSSICSGASTTFTIAASGTGLTYRWQESTDGGVSFTNLSNSAPYSTVTTATLNITAATAGLNANLYRCVVSGTCIPSAKSNAGTLTVTTSTAITTQPLNKTVCAGTNSTFSVIASGTGLTYYWQVSTNGGGSYSNIPEGSLYSNVTTAALTITAITAGMDSYKYRCVINGVCPSSLISNAGILTVNSLPTVTTQPSGSTICAGTNSTFAIVASGMGLNYRWQESTDGGVTFNNLSNAAPYFAVTTATLSIAPVTAGQNANQYRCVVSGTCSPSVKSIAGTLTVNTSASMTTQPSNRTVCAGANTTFTVIASGAVLTYRWQVSTNGGSNYSNISDGALYSNVTTAAMSITTVTTGMNNYRYRCVVGGSCGSAVTSSGGILTVNTTAVPAITSQSTAAQTICLNGTASPMSVTATGAGLTFQWYSNTVNNNTSGTIIGGANSSSFTPPTTAAGTTYYYCAVSGTCTLVAVSAVSGGILIKAIPAQPTLSQVLQPTCAIATGSFTIANYDGSYTYIATPSVGVSRSSGLLTAQVGSYTIKASFNGCTSQASTTVTVNEPTSMPTDPISVTTQPSCAVPTGTISVSVQNVGETYSFDNGINFQSGNSKSGLGAGTYHIMIKSADGCNSDAIAVAVTPLVTKTWDGSTWTPAGAPTADENIVFAGDYTINSDTKGCSCQVTSGNVIIASGHSLSLRNSIDVTGGSLTFENNSSLVQMSEAPNHGEIIYKRIPNGPLIHGFDNIYWSSPVAAQAINGLYTTPVMGPSYYWAADYANSNGTQGNWFGASGNMGVGRGYLIRAASNKNWTGTLESTFKGVPNNGTINVPIKRGSLSGLDDNYNLIGNPYPSSISARDFLTKNSAVLTGTVDIWRHNTAPSSDASSPFYNNYTYNYNPDDYLTLNLTGSSGSPGNLIDGDYYIGAGQGFFVAMAEDATDFNSKSANVIFDNSLRSKDYSNNTGSDFYRMAGNSGTDIRSEEYNRIWLDILKDDVSLDRTLFGYVSGATMERDNLYDAPVRKKDTVKIYSVLNNDSLQIQGRAVPFDDRDEVKIGVNVIEEGQYKIAIGMVDGLFLNAAQNIYLEDKLLNTVHDLRKSPYSFSSMAGAINDRFGVRYTRDVLSTDSHIKTGNDISIFSQQHQLSVLCSSALIIKVEVYDVVGKLLFVQNLNANSYTDSLPIASQLALVRVTLDNQQVLVKKIMVD